MSDASPTGFPEPTEPDGGAGRGGRRLAVIAAVSVVVAAVLGGGAYAAYAFLDGGGPQPADVLPSSTVAVVSVDLDPSAGQKIAAIKSLREFPALKKSLGLNADDDLRRFAFDKITEGKDCGSVDFARDVLPWLGKRAAFAAVDLGGKTPAPAVVLQVSDAEKARTGITALVHCAEPGNDFGFAVGTDYVVASDSEAHARAILGRGADRPLADDAAYRKWTGEAGDSGVLSFYVAKKATDYLTDLADGIGATGLPVGPVASGDPAAAASGVLKDFRGLGGTVRFADGGMELAVAAGGLKDVAGTATVGRQIGDLPGDTAVAAGLGVPDDYARLLVDQLNGLFSGGGQDFVTETEKGTGLALPEDLQTLLGHAISLSLGGKAPASLDDVAGPEDIPAGLLVHGDADRIKAIVAKIEDHLGVQLSDVPLTLDSAGDKVALSPSGDYAGDLLKSGDLGSSGDFRAAVPDADRATGVLYVDFDSRWRDLLVDAIAKDSPADARAFDDNTKPLRSVGLSSWSEGDVSHALIKVSTD